MRFRRTALAFALLIIPCVSTGCGSASGTNPKTVVVDEAMQKKWAEDEAARQEKYRALAAGKEGVAAPTVTVPSEGIPLAPGLDKRASRMKKK